MDSHIYVGYAGLVKTKWGDLAMKKLAMLAAVAIVAVIVLGISVTADATWEHDKCQHLEGIQETVPDGLKLKEGECFKLEPIVDLPHRGRSR
jgi:hypothetical protein